MWMIIQSSINFHWFKKSFTPATLDEANSARPSRAQDGIWITIPVKRYIKRNLAHALGESRRDHGWYSVYGRDTPERYSMNLIKYKWSHAFRSLTQVIIFRIKSIRQFVALIYLFIHFIIITLVFRSDFFTRIWNRRHRYLSKLSIFWRAFSAAAEFVENIGW